MSQSDRMAQVVLRNVAKTYPGGIKAVDGLSLSIADEQFVVLVGPSGCGKTTTLRVVAGLEALTSGTIEMDGRVVNELPPKHRDVAMVFQSLALYPHMSVRKNLAFGLMLRRRELKLTRSEIDRKVEHAAAMLGIEGLLDRKPRTLSGGERQRVALGRALVRTPRIFLLDEPLSNVDARLRIEMRTEIRKLQRRLRTTTIYVTHDQEEAMSLGDVIVVMRAGQVEQVGAPNEIYARPANRFVAEFVGMPMMNFLAGRVSRDTGEFVLADGRTRFPLSDRLGGTTANEGDAVLGIRPQQVSRDARGRETVALDVTVTLVQALGESLDVHTLTSTQETLVLRLPAETPVTEGQTLRVYLELDRAHLFAPGPSGRNLGLSMANEKIRAN